MTFLRPTLLLALPLAAIPVIIHLIHLYRRRQVKWAAMMFLLAAQRMSKGFSRLRQILILAFRVLALLTLLFMIARPLAGGWLGLTGGAPDTVLILLDRSASMEQLNQATGVSKRLAGLRQLSKAISDAIGTRSHLVLLESALGKPVTLPKADLLTDLPQTEATDTSADIPGLLQNALDYITTNKTGRTDLWLLSDLQRSDWDATGGRWSTLRSAFATLPGVRFHLLCYPQSAPDDLAVTVTRAVRREGAAGAELLLDLRLTRHAEHPQPLEVPLRFTVNGITTVLKANLVENELSLQAYSIPLDQAAKTGWGRVELPADANPSNDVSYFAFANPEPLRSVIVSDNEAEALPLKAALSAALDPTRTYQATILPPARAAEIAWDDTALLIWHAPLPAPDEVLAHQLQNFAASGRSLLFLPPETPADKTLFGLHWTHWETPPTSQAQPLEWWRNDADLLSNTRDGTALPLGSLEIYRRCLPAGDGVVLARTSDHQPFLLRSTAPQADHVYFLGTLPGPGASSLARDGVVLFALLHRALDYAAPSLGQAQQRPCSPSALGADPTLWHSASGTKSSLQAGVFTLNDRLLALNRPPSEDTPETVSLTALGELFAGLDFHIVTTTLEDTHSITNEVWRTFLLAMAAALLGEALLCLPPRRAASPLAHAPRA